MEKIEALSERIDQREESKFKQVLSQRHRTLLSFAQTTAPCREYLELMFDELMLYGIERSSMPGDVSEYEVWEAVFGWEESHGGIFDKGKVQEIEGGIYRKAQATQLDSMRIEEEIESGDFKELMDVIKDQINEDNRFRKMVMTEDERQTYEQEVKKGDIVALEMIQKEVSLRDILKRWRSSYIEKYDDEP